MSVLGVIGGVAAGTATLYALPAAASALVGCQDPYATAPPGSNIQLTPAQNAALDACLTKKRQYVDVASFLAFGTVIVGGGALAFSKSKYRAVGAGAAGAGVTALALYAAFVALWTSGGTKSTT